MNCRSFFVILTALILLFATGCHKKPTLTGDWQLVKVDRLLPLELFSYDSSAFSAMAMVNSYGLMWRDSLIKADAAPLTVWNTYFERCNWGWFVMIPDTHQLKWTFTDAHDSELRIYDDSNRVTTRMSSYWSSSDSNIVFSGFNGWYQAPVGFHIERLTATELILSLHTSLGDKLPLRLYFKKISDQPGRDITLSGKRYEDLKNHIASKNIVIQKKNKHPFLRDHDRVLVVMTDDGHIIGTHDLETDTGEGCMGSLFDDKDFFLVVDCNGEFYKVNKDNGIISNSGWYWMEDPKKKYLGTYYCGREDYYTLAYDSAYSYDKLYSIKDPSP